MRVIGITGRIGTGKSTLSRWLVEQGAIAIDADSLVRMLYASDLALHDQLRRRFGTRVVIGSDVDRAALGRAVFDDPVALADLEAIVHPAVRRLRDEHLLRARATGAPAALVEAIKLVESGGSADCDELWIVVANERVQLARLAARGVDEAEARRRLAAQGTIASWSEQFLAESARLGRVRPIIIFDNSGTETEGKTQATRLWRGIS
jgi:dephospho-CoA kinase